jgi:hypothetical protein
VTVDFGLFDVAGSDVNCSKRTTDPSACALNLPAHSRVRFRMQQGDATNEAEYSAYRIAQFGSDTRIQFGEETGEEDR